MSSQNTTPNGQNHPTKTRRPPSRVKRPRTEENWSQGTSSDEESGNETTPARSSSRIRSKKLNKSKGDNNSSPSLNQVKMQDSKRLLKGQSDGSQAVPQKMKVLSTLPNTWCCTKISNVNHTCEWTIDNFSLLSLKKPGEAIWSSQFKMPRLANLECRLSVYPNGHSDDCKNNVCCIIELSENTVQEVDFKLKLCNGSRTKVIDTFDFRTNCGNKKNKMSGVCCIVKRNELLSLLGEDDKLIAFCSLSISNSITYTNSADDADVSQDFQNKLEILNDINELRSSKDFCNMTLGIEEEEFCAHASILAARSLYFEKLLASNKEKKFMKLNINGIKGPVFKEILHYIYAGQVLDMETYVNELYQAADDFGLPSLKTMCRMHFKKNLSLNNALGILTLADKVNALDLKQNVINYIVAYSSDIVNSPSFAVLVKKLSTELMLQVLKEVHA